MMTAGYIHTKFPLSYSNGNVVNLNTTSFVLKDPQYGAMIFDSGSPYERWIMVKRLWTEFSIRPDDVRYIFFTHLHPDHAGLLTCFRNAKIVVSKFEYDYLRNLAFIATTGGDVLGFLHNSSENYKKMYNLVDAENIRKYITHFWDDEIPTLNYHFIEDFPDLPVYIEPVATPGHSIAHYGFLIKRAKCDVFVAGDALSNRFLFGSDEVGRDDIQMFMDEYMNTRQQFKYFKGVMVPGHDRPFFTQNRKILRGNLFDIDEISCDI